MTELEKHYRDRGRGIRAFFSRRLPRGEEPEDYLQEVFLQGLEAAAEGTVLHDSASWLFAVARRRIADAWRRRGKVSEKDLDDLADILVTAELGPEDLYLAEEASAAVRTALDCLPAEQREVLVLHVMEELTFREIGEIQGVSPNTAMARKRYALAAMKKELIRLRWILKEMEE